MKRIEDFIQYKCAQWLRDNKVLHCHVPNATKRSPREGARLKAMGMVSGVDDLLLFFYPKTTVLVEIKTLKGSLSPDQIRWHDATKKRGFHRHTIQTDDWQVAVQELEQIVMPFLVVERSHNL